MRELKFRAWLKKYNCYAEVLGFDRGKLIVHLQRGELVEHRLYVPIGDCVLEQYIGLKDKNGKEIYVGDIIRIDSMDELRVGYVDLVNDQYCIVCGVDEDGYKIVAEFYYYSKPEENCEVIGNIHENPELLGDTDIANKEEEK